MTIKTFKRYEKKYILSQNQFTGLKKALSEHMQPDEYCKEGKNYTIYNIYYDTQNDDIIRQSLAKPDYKEKLRFRSYKIPASPNDKVFLELKKKINGIVSKRRAVMTLSQAEELIKTGKAPQLNSFIDNQVAGEIAYFLSCHKVVAKVFISYERLAFFDKNDKNFRITFDSNILTRRKEVSLESGDYGNELLDSNTCLMEIKITGSVPIWLASILSELKIYSTSFSKYGTEYKRYIAQRGLISSVSNILNKNVSPIKLAV